MLKLFIILPFIFSIFIGIAKFLKNPIIIRRIAKSFLTIQFLFSILILFKENTSTFSLFNLDFSFNGFCACLMFLANLVFFLYSIISKTQIKRFHRFYYSGILLVLGLLDLTLLADNIFSILFFIFLLLILNYFLNVLFAKKEYKKTFDIQIINDLFWFFIGSILIISNFGKFFLINNLAFDFSNLSHNLYNIDEQYVYIAFFGFLIIIGKLFNLIPFGAKNNFLSQKTNPIVFSLNTLVFTIIGCNLFLKCYLNFDYILYEIQAELAFYLLFNFVVFAILTTTQKQLFKFLTNIFTLNIIIGLISIFSFEKDCFNIFAYFILSLCISYMMCAFVFSILSWKMKTSNLDDFCKIIDATRFSQIFTSISLLNFGCVPLFSIFSTQLICLMMIFSVDFDKNILNIFPYFAIIGIFIAALNVFEVLYKILIKPNIKTKINFSLCNHQILVFIILTFTIILLGICPKCVLGQIDTIIQVENF